MRKVNLFIKLGIATLVLVQTAKSQTIPVGMTGFDDQLRVLQLQGKLNISHSLMARPFMTGTAFTMDSFYHVTDSSLDYQPVRKEFWNGKGKVEALSPNWYTRFNSDHPYGWNQPGFIQAKGWQTLISAGLYASAGWLSVQFKPEYVYAGNPAFPYNGNYGAPVKGNYSKFFMGQSSVRINKGPVSMGLSTENLFWGPGIYNSLLMSSNAPGFTHFTFNSTRPVKTPIGNFEWQLIAGKLVEDTSLLLENKNLTTAYYNPESYDGSGNIGPYDPKKNWRYLSGLTITYNPKWIKGLFISINRVGYSYDYKLKKYGDGYSFLQKYVPVIFGVLRNNSQYGNATANYDIGYKQMASFAARFVFPNSHAEVYAEYGYGDNFSNLRDWNTDAPHATAYIGGFRKLKELKKGKWLDISAEMVHMAEPVNYLVRTAGDWYSYQGGYTNQNRILGAGVGPGNNAYTGRIALLSGFSRVGLVLQGIQHGPTKVVGGLPNFGIREVKWNDFAIGLSGQKRFHKVLMSAELQSVNTKNYAWEKDNHRFNFYGFVAISYLW